MKVLVTANLTPFMYGGADSHISGLVAALRGHGYEAEILRLPFKFNPPAEVERLMEFCEGSEFSRPNDIEIDCMISLQFPGYGMRHPNHVAWVMHQHRLAYELYGRQPADPALDRLCDRARVYDREALSRTRALFANSQRVAERLKKYNGLDAAPLYHPPAMAERYFAADAEAYVFYPSRLERLKRQDLLIEAARLLRSPVAVLIAGDGGQRNYYESLIEQYGLRDRVKLLGRITDGEKIAFYARSLGVFFGPYDEDYGYVTLEAMLSAKPVITCTDSGGPLEFVQNGGTGWIVSPDPQAVAERIDWLYEHRDQARDMGRAGRERYDAFEISWGAVVQALVGPP